MLVYRCLLTITLTWQSSCVLANYNQKTIEIYLFKHVANLATYFEADDVKKYTQKHLNYNDTS